MRGIAHIAKNSTNHSSYFISGLCNAHSTTKLAVSRGAFAVISAFL
jgi:hypothetical protein